MRNWKAVSIKQVWAACQCNVSFQQNRNNSQVSGWVSAALHTAQGLIKAQNEHFAASHTASRQPCRKRIAAEMGLHQSCLRSRTGTRQSSTWINFLVSSFVLSPQICWTHILLQYASINPQRIYLGSASRMEMLWPLDVDRWVAYSHVLYYWQ